MRRTKSRLAAGLAPLLLLAGLAATPSLTGAAGGGSPAPAPPPSPTPQPSQEPLSPAEQAALDRAEAEDSYGKGLKELEKADKEYAEARALEAKADAKSLEQAAKKGESAAKRYRKAGERFRDAVTLAPEYADAWNYLGYSLRRSGGLEEAFEAYWRCLKLDPNHAGAHEYLGEAWLEKGRLDQAEGELAWLTERGAPEAKQLEEAIRRYREANPQASAAADSARRAQGIDTPAAVAPASGK